MHDGMVEVVAFTKEFSMVGGMVCVFFGTESNRLQVPLNPLQYTNLSLTLCESFLIKKVGESAVEKPYFTHTFEYSMCSVDTGIVILVHQLAHKDNVFPQY